MRSAFCHQGVPDLGDWNGNLSKWLTKAFPDRGAWSDPFFAVMRGIESGKYEGAQVDWGSWVAKMTKDQILGFIAEHYGDEAWPPKWSAKMQALLEEIRALQDSKIYGLVAYEDA